MIVHGSVARDVFPPASTSTRFRLGKLPATSSGARPEHSAASTGSRLSSPKRSDLRIAQVANRVDLWRTPPLRHHVDDAPVILAAGDGSFLLSLTAGRTLLLTEVLADRSFAC